MKTIFVKKHDILFLFCMTLIILVSIEIAARLFWKIKFKVSFFHPEEVIYVFYPELWNIHDSDPLENDESFNILMLGGSALSRDRTDIEKILEEQLAQETRQKINIYNVSVKGHSSLDSYYKYKYSENIQFDLVLFYNGINETRANNCPPKSFREDYSHYIWYSHIHSYERQRRIIRYSAVPFTLNYVFIRFLEELSIYKFVPEDEPEKEWLEYGLVIKSQDSFGRNLNGVIEMAELRKEPILLMTFAYYVPEDYSEDKFQNKSLDYDGHHFPIELWGKPDNVIAGIEAHNRIIRQAANDNKKNIFFVDQEKLLPKNGKYFRDICHFSYQGSEIFVNNIVAIIKGATRDSIDYP